MTQALAVHRNLSRWGHELVGVAAGRHDSRSLPDFFARGFEVPVTPLRSPGFAFRRSRSIDLPATLWTTLRGVPAYRDSLARLRALVDETRPDLVLNFFEPLTGLLQLIRPLPIPVVAVAHQHMIDHPAYVKRPGGALDRLGLALFAGLVGARSWKLALSLSPAEDLPARRLLVGPPLLRPELFELVPARGDYVLVYLVNHGYSEDIRSWHRANPEVPLHCFYDRPGAPTVEAVDDTLAFHRLDGRRFLEMMAGCRAVVSTAGFESVCEAAWLGKPLLVVPVQNHAEQMLNALDVVQAGFGISDASFRLDRLRELPDRIDNARFRDWVSQGEEVLERVLGLAFAAGPRTTAAR
jgi:uncharacterized protein (TIGR00661 family)